VFDVKSKQQYLCSKVGDSSVFLPLD